LKASEDGYFRCQNNCGFKSKTVSKLIYFKGQSLCFHCKLKKSKAVYYPLKENPKDSTLRTATRLPEGRHMPRERWKGMKRVTADLRNWAQKKEKPIQEEMAKPKHVFWDGLTPQEERILWRHFYKEGISEKEIDSKIKAIEDQVRKAHQEFKRGLKLEKPSFQEEFNKLVEKRK